MQHYTACLPRTRSAGATGPAEGVPTGVHEAWIINKFGKGIANTHWVQRISNPHNWDYRRAADACAQSALQVTIGQLYRGRAQVARLP